MAGPGKAWTCKGHPKTGGRTKGGVDKIIVGVHGARTGLGTAWRSLLSRNNKALRDGIQLSEGQSPETGPPSFVAIAWTVRL